MERDLVFRFSELSDAMEALKLIRKRFRFPVPVSGMNYFQMAKDHILSITVNTEESLSGVENILKKKGSRLEKDLTQVISGIPKRRKYPRIDAKIQVQVEDAGISGYKFAENISRGGMFIRTDKYLPLDSKVHLTIPLPKKNKEVKVLGRVAYIREKVEDYGEDVMGVEFLNFEDEYDKDLFEYIDEIIDEHLK
jgi:type IV pilus assembly protein PilZ